jgi:hypothetical protein
MDLRMPKPPNTVTAAHFLILINALVWLAFGIITATGAHPSLPDSPLIQWGMAILSLVTSGTLLTLFIFLRRRNRFAFFASLAFLAVLAALTIADEVGLVDLLVLIVIIAAIAFLLVGRAWYLQPAADRSDPPQTG